MERIYRVFWVGGRRDGELLGIAITEIEAIEMARELYKLHEDEFDPKWGGIGIVAPDGSDVEW